MFLVITLLPAFETEMNRLRTTRGLRAYLGEKGQNKTNLVLLSIFPLFDIDIIKEQENLF